jgi:hypothetical protein
MDFFLGFRSTYPTGFFFLCGFTSFSVSTLGILKIPPETTKANSPHPGWLADEIRTLE